MSKTRTSLFLWKHTTSSTTFGHGLAQAVSQWLLTTEAWDQFQDTSCGICNGKSGTEGGFLSEHFSFPWSIIVSAMLLTHFSLRAGMTDPSEASVPTDSALSLSSLLQLTITPPQCACARTHTRFIFITGVNEW
jgi:hypothetical protein